LTRSNLIPPANTCALCRQSLPLLRSHVLPEFVYKPTYNAQHTAVLYDLESGKKGKRQKGFTERLLCATCEAHIGRWENYFARVWLHPQHSVRPTTLVGGTVTVQGLDYAQFKLFHMSLIWRAGASQLKEFKHVHLGAQQETMRRRLLADDPGAPDEYPVFGIAMRDPATGGFQDKLVKGFDSSRVGGHWVHVALFGGVLWHYYTSGHSTGREVPVYFSPAGNLTLAVQDWTDNVFVRSLASQIQAQKP
jgi:hypothetical protein